MSYQEFDPSGQLRVWHDDETRKVYRYDANGVELLPAEDYTPEQNAEADAEAARLAASIALDAQRAAVKVIVTDLKAEKDRVQPVIDKANSAITGADTKDVARAAKRIADAAIDIAKLLDGRV